MRQRGIQEVDGIALCEPITKATHRATSPFTFGELQQLIDLTRTPRRGPVFLEICLDVQGAPVSRTALRTPDSPSLPVTTACAHEISALIEQLRAANRPVLLLGGGVSRTVAREVQDSLDNLGIPVLTSWNGADRYAADRPMWFGRPDTWGMRSANLIMQQADLLIALGARLSLQQTGFNWQKFVPNGTVIHVDIDSSETDKGHPASAQVMNVDADDILRHIASTPAMDVPNWVSYCHDISTRFPLADLGNSVHEDFFDPYDFVLRLSNLCEP